MKIRWTRRTLRVRLDDLEFAALARGEGLREAISFPGGSWAIEVRTAQEGEFGLQDGVLLVTLSEAELRFLARGDHDGVEREGQPRLMVERELMPRHLEGA